MSNDVRDDSVAVTGERKKAKSTFREYAESIVFALLLALFIRSFIVQAFKIPSGSMIPTLQIGDHILVNKLSYGIRSPFWDLFLVSFKKPQRGDVVVFIFPEDRSKDFIKRVTGIEGDMVEIREKRVYINGKPLEDPHAHFEGDAPERGPLNVRDNYGPKQVPENFIFVMGDNRDRSYDSRYWGYVNLDDVKGRAFMIYWSWDGMERWVRWERIGSLIY
ncbi:MAG: signal peptidase I [Candidatus Binatota bacterium]